MDKLLLLRASVQQMDCLLSLNSMVVGKLKAGVELCLPVHEFIQAGANSLQLISLATSNGAACTGRATKDCDFQVSLEIRKDRGPLSLVQGTVLYQVGGSVARGDYLKDALLLDVSLDLPLAFPRWRFLDVLHTETSAADITKVEAFLLDLIRNLQAARLPEVLRIFSARNREVAAAYHLDVQQASSDFHKYLDDTCTGSSICESTLDAGNWRFHAVGKAAVYAVLNRDFNPLLQFHFPDTGRRLLVPMHLGVLGDEVFVLR
jgi:hypothetical protein